MTDVDRQKETSSATPRSTASSSEIHLSEFEIGQIAALDGIKKAILQWFSFGFAIITVIAGLLATVGLSAVIDLRVSTEVAKRLDKLSELTDETRVAAGVIRSQTEEDLSRLSKLVAEIEESRIRIENIVKDEEISNIVQAMIVDFYTPRTMVVRAYVKFSRNLSDLPYQYAFQIDLDDLNNNRSLQFRIIRESLTLIGEDAIDYNLEPYSPTVRALEAMKSIEELNGLNSLQIRDYTEAAQATPDTIEKTRQYVNAIELVEVRVLINGTVIDFIRIEKPNFEREDQNGDVVFYSNNPITTFVDTKLRYQKAKFELNSNRSSEGGD
ncbi:MAG: hypothetical protein OXR62_03650 [Ahrensia sp.]|nr:hypothetical protein [Ahrensia sp.]